MTPVELEMEMLAQDEITVAKGGGAVTNTTRIAALD